MRRALLWIPALAFLIVFVSLKAGLWSPTPGRPQSPLIGKAMPAFALKPMIAGKPGVSGGRGKPRLVNIFGSWCVPCMAEAPQLMRLKAMGVPIDAIAIRDTAPEVTAFLRRHGDPFARIGDDPRGLVQKAIGSSGVPESYVVGSDGVIIEHHIGEIREDDVGSIAAMVANAR